MFSKITLIIVCCLIFIGCSSHEKTLTIDFTTDSNAIVVSGLDDANLYKAEQLLLTDSLSEALVSVVKLADAENTKEYELKGKLMIKAADLLFYPDTPFTKDHRYMVRTILGSSFGKTKDILKAKLGHDLKVQEQILRR